MNIPDEVITIDEEGRVHPCACASCCVVRTAIAHGALQRPEVRSSAWVDARPTTAEKYYELLYAVGRKYEGETRHETALRYIQQAERNYESAQASTGADKPHDE